MAQPADLQTTHSDLEQPTGLGGSPRWRPAGEMGALPDDAVLASWLTNAGSLTQRLRGRGQDSFELDVIGEGHEPATAHDRQLLGTDDSELYVRRVRLCVAGQLLVHACTLAPAATLARQPWLGRLGGRPLGEALATHSGVCRTDFEYASIDADRPPRTTTLEYLDVEPPGLWGRRSLFLVEDAPILVYEFFLPALAAFGPA